MIGLCSVVDGFDDGVEEEVEDDFEQILSENIDGASGKRFERKINLHIGFKLFNW